MPSTQPHGPDGAPPLCWLHGFTQTGHSAHRFRSILAAHRTVLLPDLPGHGPAHDISGSLPDIADALVVTFPEEPIDLGGYSLGARVALHVALRHPNRVRRLILLGATRGIADVEARRRRLASDEKLAERLIGIGPEAFIDEWISQPLFGDVPFDAAERDARRGHDADALASSLRCAGTGTQEFLGPKLGELVKPTLALAGARDDRFVREAAAISSDVAHGRFVVVPGAGHAAHLVQPEWVAKVVSTFLA